MFRKFNLVRIKYLCAEFLICILCLISITGCSREKQTSQSSPATVTRDVLTEETVPAPTKDDVLATTTVLATIGAGEKVVVTGSHGAPAGFSGIIFSKEGRGVVYTEEKDGLFRVVHNGKPGKLYEHIEGLAISLDGSRTAFVARVGGKYCVVADGKEGRIFDNVGFPRFSPDSRHIVYNATDSGRGRLVVDERVSEPFPSNWDELFSGDSKKVISIQNSAAQDTMHRVVIYDLLLQNRREIELNASYFIYNKGKDRIAAIGLDQGKQQLLTFAVENPEKVNKGRFYDRIFNHTFGPDGVSVTYLAVKGGKLAIVLDGKEEMLPEGDPIDIPAVRPDGKAAGILLADKGGHFFHQAFSVGSTKPKKYHEAGQTVYSNDGKQHAYLARRDKHVFTVVNGEEGPAFDMVIAPMFSPDGKFLVYRARKDGKRFVVVADADGKTPHKHPAYEQVFMPVFTADGKSIAYGVKDGEKLIWKVEKLP